MRFAATYTFRSILHNNKEVLRELPVTANSAEEAVISAKNFLDAIRHGSHNYNFLGIREVPTIEEFRQIAAGTALPPQAV